MEDLARFLIRLHITGGIGNELTESDVSILFKGVSPFFRSFSFGYVHRFRVVIYNFCIG